MPKRKLLRPGHAGYRTKATTPTGPPPRPQAVRLPSTAQIDRRMRRQHRKYLLGRADLLRLKDPTTRKGRRMRNRWAKAPGAIVRVHAEGTHLVFRRPPDRRFKFGTEYIVPLAGVHPIYGPCYFLDSYMVLNQQLLRTIPSRRLLVSRGPTLDTSLVFKALSQEWVRVPSDRSNRIGYHRWLCYLVTD